jgi:hypothetical protein
VSGSGSQSTGSVTVDAPKGTSTATWGSDSLTATGLHGQSRTVPRGSSPCREKHPGACDGVCLRRRGSPNPILHGWMLASCTQHPAQVEEFRTIEMQCFHGSPACRSKAYDDYEILTPGEVP